MPRRRASQIVALIWGINILGLLVILGVVLFRVSQRPVQAAVAPPPVETPRVDPIYTAPPTLYYLPTITRNPLATPIEGVTPTPFLLASGRRATIIGLSVSGRPIEVFTFGQGERQRMIVAGIHGGYEWNTIALADELITYLDAHPEEIPSDLTLFILRNLNPDGDARGHDRNGRANDRGVDLNRNFPVNWQADWPRDGCWKDPPVTGGESPASESETRALVKFIETHQIDALISYHSAALGVFPGGTPWEEDSIRLAKEIAKLTTYPYPPLDTGCLYTGTLADFAVGQGAAAVDLELSNHRDTDFEMNLKILLMFMNWER
ncbi:MAG: M14 family metallopeptidase [Chloroflexota bacterium]